MEQFFLLTSAALDAAMATAADGGVGLLGYLSALDARDMDKCMEYWVTTGDYHFIEPLLSELEAEKDGLSSRKPSQNSELCTGCGSVDFVEDIPQCSRICISCGICTYDSSIHPANFVEWESHDHRSYTRIVKYSRMVNMKSILRNLQGYPSPLKPPIRSFIAEVRPWPELTISGLRMELRRRKLSVSLDMCPNILESINPTYQPLRLTHAQEVCILGEFYRIVSTFISLQAEGKIKRKNFLSYHFVLSKIIRRVNLGTFMRRFLILPKCKATQIKQEREWRKIRTRYKLRYSISS